MTYITRFIPEYLNKREGCLERMPKAGVCQFETAASAESRVVMALNLGDLAVAYQVGQVEALATVLVLGVRPFDPESGDDSSGPYGCLRDFAADSFTEEPFEGRDHVRSARHLLGWSSSPQPASSARRPQKVSMSLLANAHWISFARSAYRTGRW